MNWLTIRDLEYLVAVAEHGHFGKAAAAVHVSQPALSAQIKKVEDRLGVLVFERTNRTVRVTELGREVIEQARVVLAEAMRLGQIAARRHAPLEGRFRLGAIATLGPYLFPHLLPPLRKAYPSLDLSLKEGLTETLISELKAGELDAVLASPTFEDDAVEMIPLFFEPFRLAVPKNHRLASRPHVSARDLDASEMVLLEDGHCLRDQTIEFCPTHRKGGTRRFHAASLETIRQLVATGAGYTLMPLLALKNGGQLKELIRYRELEAGSGRMGRPIGLFYRRRFAGSRDLIALAELVKSHLPDGIERVSPKTRHP